MDGPGSGLLVAAFESLECVRVSWGGVPAGAVEIRNRIRNRQITNFPMQLRRSRCVLGGINNDNKAVQRPSQL